MKNLKKHLCPSVLKSLSVFICVAVLSSVLISVSCKQEPKTIKIGAILPLTGPAAEPGSHILNGIKLSLLGDTSKFTVLVENSKNSPKDAISAFNKLINLDKVQIIITALSSVTLAILPEIELKKVPTIITLSNYPDIASKSSWAVRFFINSVNEGVLMSRFLISRGVRSIGIIHMNDEGSVGTAIALREKFIAEGGAVTQVEIFDKNKQDFRDIAIKAKTWKVDALALIGYGKPLGTLVKQLREANVNLLLISSSTMGASDAQTAAGEATYTELYYIAPFFEFNMDTLSEKFKHLYKQKFNAEPDFVSAYGYDLGNIIAEVVLKQKGNFDPKLFFEDICNYVGYGVTGSIRTLGREIGSELVIVTNRNMKREIVFKW